MRHWGLTLSSSLMGWHFWNFWSWWCYFQCLLMFDAWCLMLDSWPLWSSLLLISYLPFYFLPLVMFHCRRFLAVPMQSTKPFCFERCFSPRSIYPFHINIVSDLVWVGECSTLSLSDHIIFIAPVAIKVLLSHASIIIPIEYYRYHDRVDFYIYTLSRITSEQNRPRSRSGFGSGFGLGSGSWTRGPWQK